MKSGKRAGKHGRPLDAVTTLAESLSLWERGEELARICQAGLDGARQRLDAALADDPE